MNCLINIKVLIKSFVNINYVKKHKLLTISLIKLYRLRLVDDKLILNITHMTRL